MPTHMFYIDYLTSYFLVVKPTHADYQRIVCMCAVHFMQQVIHVLAFQQNTLPQI